MPERAHPGVSLAPMRWWHVEQVRPIEEQLFSPDTWSAETFWSELAAPHTTYTVALDQDCDVVGYAGLSVSGADSDVQTVAVAPGAQGRGLGRLLLSTLVDLAHARGATSLMLEVRADNEAAIALYVGAGFRRIAVRRRYYQPGDIDAHIMRLRPLVPTSARATS